MSAWRGQLAVTTCVSGRIAAEGAHPWAIPSRASMPERRVESAKRPTPKGCWKDFLMTRHQPEICSHPSARPPGVAVHLKTPMVGHARIASRSPSPRPELMAQAEEPASRKEAKLKPRAATAAERE